MKSLPLLAAFLVLAACEKPTGEPAKADPAPLTNPRWRMDYAPPDSLAAVYAPAESDNLYYRIECRHNRLTALIYMDPVSTKTMPRALQLELRDRRGGSVPIMRGDTRATEQGWAADFTMHSRAFFEIADERPDIDLRIGAINDPNPHWTEANDVIRDVLMDCSKGVAN